MPETPTTPTGPVGDVVAEVEAIFQKVEDRAKAIVVGGESFLERHIAPDVARVLAFFEAHQTNAVTFETNVAAALAAVNPAAAPEVQAAIKAANAAAKEDAKLLGAFLHFLASKAPKTLTEKRNAR